MTTPVPRFESPDGHAWHHDADHQTRPRSHLARAMFERGFGAGFTRAFEFLGAPLAEAQATHVHGWTYTRMVPAGAPDRPGPPPPAPVLRVLTRLHPELRRRDRRARRVLAERAWVADIDRWWAEEPELEQAYRAHQRVDLGSLDRAELRDEVATLLERADRMALRHFELTTPAVAIGLLIVEGERHGIPPATTVELLRGTSAATSSAADSVAAIAEALEAAGVGPVASLDDIRAGSDDAAKRLDAHLDRFGWRVLGDDLVCPTLAERPALVVHAVEQARQAGDPETDDPWAAIPASGRGALEPLLVDAGRANHCLDSNSGYLCWAVGILRRGVRHAGDVLARDGALDDADHVFDLEADELLRLIDGDTSPTPSEVARRHADRLAAEAHQPPPVIGGPAYPPPDPAVFPIGLRRLTEAIRAHVTLRSRPIEAPAVTDVAPGDDDHGSVLQAGRVVAAGVGVGSSPGTGRAVVAASPEDAIERIEPGDVLVCAYTNPAYNAIFPIVAAVVTATGGALSHAAVTAREVGIPAVVGVGALDGIVDGAAAEVRP